MLAVVFSGLTFPFEIPTAAKVGAPTQVFLPPYIFPTFSIRRSGTTTVPVMTCTCPVKYGHSKLLDLQSTPYLSLHPYSKVLKSGLSLASSTLFPALRFSCGM